MSTVTAKKDAAKVSIPISVDELAESIWQLPPRQRESLVDILEEKFVKTVLRRAKEIPRLRREKKLLSLRDIKRAFVH